MILSEPLLMLRRRNWRFSLDSQTCGFEALSNAHLPPLKPTLVAVKDAANKQKARFCWQLSMSSQKSKFPVRNISE